MRDIQLKWSPRVMLRRYSISRIPKPLITRRAGYPEDEDYDGAVRPCTAPCTALYGAVTAMSRCRAISHGTCTVTPKSVIRQTGHSAILHIYYAYSLPGTYIDLWRCSEMSARPQMRPASRPVASGPNPRTIIQRSWETTEGYCTPSSVISGATTGMAMVSRCHYRRVDHQNMNGVRLVYGLYGTVRPNTAFSQDPKTRLLSRSAAI